MPESPETGKSLGVPVSKVRPVVGSSDDSQSQPSHQYHLYASKVRPTVLEEPDAASLVALESPSAIESDISPRLSSLKKIGSFLSSDNAQPRSDLDNIAEFTDPEESPLGTQAVANNFVVPTAKVRPFLAVPDQSEDDHQYHLHASKVRPFTDFQVQSEDDQGAFVETYDKPHTPPLLPPGHSISDDEKFDAAGQPETHRMSNDVPNPMASADPSHKVEDDDRYPVFSESHGHQLRDDQDYPGEALLDEHSMSACDEFPVYGAPQRHSMPSCEKTAMQPLPEAHKISQCSEYDVWSGPKLHHVQADDMYPVTVADIHRGSQCDNYPMRSGPVQHTLSIDDRYPTQTLSTGQHGLGTCTLYPSGPLIRDTTKWAPSFDISGTEQYWGLREAHGDIQRARPSQNPGRSHSDTSGLDYKRTIEWLRDFLGYVEPYSPELTRLPSLQKTLNDLPPEQRRISEPLPPRSPTARRRTQKSTPSVSSNPKIDGLGFQRVVSDLERLLSEAVTLASQVVDSPGSSNAGTGKQYSSGNCVHAHASVFDRRDQGTGPSSIYESPEELSEIDVANSRQATRPLVPHAATFSGQLQRPRLQDVVQKYSGNDENLMTKDIIARPRRATAPRKLAEDVKIYIPQRKSSRSVLKPQAPSKVLKKRRSSKKPPPVDHLPCDEKELVDFDAEEPWQEERPIQRSAISQHTPYQYVGDEDLPQRDVAGRQMPHEHGISLRHKSHVSLHGVQGFSLPRSHKRQPIARD